MKRLCATALLIVWGLCALAVGKSGTVIRIDGSNYYLHTVQPGETLYALAREYEVGEQVILQHNPSVAGGLRAGDRIRIPYVASASTQRSEKKLRKTFDMHFVSKGETLYGISRQYEIPIRTIIDDNPDLDPVHLRLGERILIRRKQIGRQDEAATAAQWEEYRRELNKAAGAAGEGHAYHIVQPGETFYSLARRFGTTEAQLSALNGGLQAADLKAGAMLKVPGQTLAAHEEHPSADTVFEQPAPDPYGDSRIEEVEFRARRLSQPLEVALLLPVAVDGDAKSNYLEFYQGFLLGLDSVKTRYGHSVHLTLYNTGRDAEKAEQIVRSDEFRRSDLIVGPVYEEVLYPVVRFAEQERIPVVTPLANISKMNSDVLFQMAPDPAHKYEKVADLIGGDRRVTLIYTENTDAEFEQEILALLGDSEYARHTFRYQHPSAQKTAENTGDLTPLLENADDNVFIIMADNEIDVDRILAALASADTSLTSRGRTAPRFVVLGNARWNRYNNIDRTVFFKDRVVLISTYHAKRDSEVIVDFDSAYIRAFGALPTLYSYRGYDAAMIFVPGMYNDIEYDMAGRRYTPLQTSYVFSQAEGRHNHVNRNWTRVNYNNDFTIKIE